MIPPSNSRPFGRVLTPLSEIDLARLIVRTGQLAAEAHHEQGWAAFAIGCDGRKRTTIFDGSACQVEGEVCLAQRQDGISSCIDAPARGSGLTSQAIVFKSAACEPVTGWWLLDDEGYLYKIPADLVTAVAYYPEDPATAGRRYDLVRSGTWAVLMCGDALTPPVDNGEGGCEWQTFSIDGETIASTIQYFFCRLGGILTRLITVPSVSSLGSTVTVGPFSGRWRGGYSEKLTDTGVSLSSTDGAGHTLTAGQEYKAILYGLGFTGFDATVNIIKGVRAAAGEAVLPTITDSTHIPLAEVTVPYSGVVVATAVGSTVPTNWNAVRELTTDSDGALDAFRGIVLRDVDEPNPGVRVLDVTLPAAGSGVVTGPVRIGYGYAMAFEHLTELLGAGAPYGYSGDATPGPYSGRVDGDMALVYGAARMAVEYGPWHLNLAGPDIAEPDDWEQLSNQSAVDVTANLIQLPSSEVCLSRSVTDGGTPIVPQMLERHRVRPAPDTAPTVTVGQTTIPSYGADPNVWTTYLARTVTWTPGGTTVTLPSGAWTHGRDLQVVCWQSKTGQLHWSLDAAAVYGTIGEPSGTACPVTLTLGGGLPALQAGATRKVSFLGPRLVVQYGWTFTRDGAESALSPLSELLEVFPATATYDLTVGVPLGPDGTDERTVYRFAYDREPLRYNPTPTTVRWRRPWSSVSERAGAVYDRMLKAVGTIPDNVTETWLDDQTSLDFAGTRPPSPLIPAGSGITLDTRRRVYALPPLNL